MQTAGGVLGGAGPTQARLQALGASCTGNWAHGDLGKQSPWSPSFHPLGLLPVASPADSPASCCQACRHEHPERLLPLPRVTGNLKGTFDLLVAFETLRRPCQCNPWLARLRAKSQHPGGPGAGRARVVWGRFPGAFGHRSLACAFQPTGRLLGALPRHTEFKQWHKEWWLDASVDLATDVVLCCRCPSVTFTEDVWWVVMVVVVVVTFMGAARLPATDGASRHVAVQASFICAQPRVREDLTSV